MIPASMTNKNATDGETSARSEGPIDWRSRDRWVFTVPELENSPSRRKGMDSSTEVLEAQKIAGFVRELGKRLELSQTCLNIATVNTKRFYTMHSYTSFSKYDVGTVAIFLATKLDEQPRRFEDIIGISQKMLSPNSWGAKVGSPEFNKLADDYITLENIFLQTLGFDLNINHVHAEVLKGCTIVRASKEVTKMAYRLATTSLMMTNMWLRYRAKVVACGCIHTAATMAKWDIPKSKSGLDWWTYLDDNVKMEDLEEMKKELTAADSPTSSASSEQNSEG